MTLSRRHLWQSLAALGLVAAAEPVVEPVRRFWALDRTMVARPGEWHIVWRGPEHMGLAGVQVAAYRDRPDLPLFQWCDVPPMPQREQYTSPVVFFHEVPDGVSPKELAIDLLAKEMVWVELQSGVPINNKPIIL